jgi:putative FmdB family regulatory protein
MQHRPPAVVNRRVQGARLGYTFIAMPIYEYRCDDCGTPSSLFFRSMGAATEPQCPECGSRRMSRLVSKVAYIKPDAERIAGLDTSRVLGGLDCNDPASFERWARRTGAEFDSALGTNFRELADKTAAGDDPIERVDPGHTLRHAVDRKLSEVSGGGNGGDV